MGFKYFIFWEAGRLTERKNILFVLSFLILALVLLQVSIEDHKKARDKVSQFQEFEREKVKQFTTMTQYGVYGFRLINFPASLEIFSFNSGIFRDFSTFIDSGERLKLYKSFPAVLKKGYADYSSFWLVFGSLLFGMYGYVTFRGDQMRAFLKSIASKKAFHYIVLVRLLVILLFTLTLFLLSYLLAYINGVLLPLVSLLFLWGLFFGFSILFFFIGLFLGFKKRIVVLMATWFILVFLLPEIGNLFYSANYNVNLYGLEKEKLKIFTDFERMVLDKVGRVKENNWNQPTVHQLYDLYMDKYFPRIIDIDKILIDSIRVYGNVKARSSLFIPSLFFKVAIEELSGNGSLSLIDFYEYSLKTKQGFFKHYAGEKFFGKNKPKVFFKGNENIFFSGSRFPVGFFPGVVLNLLYCLFLFWLSYSAFTRNGSSLERKEELWSFDLQTGKVNYFLTSLKEVKTAVRLFFEGGETPFTFTLDGGVIGNRNFIYLPSLTSLPNAQTLSGFLFGGKYPGTLKREDILFDYAVSVKKIIILDNFFKDLSPAKINQFILRIKTDKLKVLIISGDYYLAQQIASPPLLYAANDHSVDVLKGL